MDVTPRQKIQQKADLDVARQSRVAPVIFLLLWAVIAIAGGLYDSHPTFVVLNSLVVLSITSFRVFTLRNFKDRYLENPERTRQLLVSGFFMSALHWGSLGAYILYEPSFEPIVMPYFCSMIGIASVSLFYLCTSMRLAMTYYCLMFLPMIPVNLWLGGVTHNTVAIISLLYLAGLYIVGRGFHRMYWLALTNSILLDRRAKQLAELSSTDGLTGLKNRLHFNKKFAEEWKRAHRIKSPLSVLMVDLDHFKSVNDNYGHLTGDNCLKAVAKSLTEIINRPTDIIARFGGEEFVVVLTDTNEEGAVVVAESICDSIRNLSFYADEYTITLSVSIGIATAVPNNHDNHDSLLSIADQALYAAKEAGRDQYQIGAFEEERQMEFSLGSSERALSLEVEEA